VTTLKET